MRPTNRLMITLMALVLLGGPLTVLSFQSQPAAEVGYAPVKIQKPGYTLTPTPTPFQAVTSTSTPTRTSTRPATLTPQPTNTMTATNTFTATITPTLPTEARIEGVTGFGQALPLSCEARAAVDWANFFGVHILEMDFFNRLPKSEDPELGFVGSPYGTWGQIPPDPYGIHAEPVAELLRRYGLKAAAGRGVDLGQVQAEVSAGRPVIVWVVGHVEPGTGVQIKIHEQTRTVARFEHTVMVIGYDPQYIMILDNGQVYLRLIDVFNQSWGALDNMAIYFKD